MKKIITPVLLFLCNFSFAQNVGIGTTDPKAKLHVADSSVLFGAPNSLPSNPPDPPLSGGGTRMMWYAGKAALRAGAVEYNAWDKNNIGNYSVALGYNNMASGRSAVALGEYSNATGLYSFAMGYGTSAEGNTSAAIGQGVRAVGENSFASGLTTEAIGNNSFAAGQNSKAKAFGGFTIGLNNDINDNPAANNPSLTDRIFQIGNGVDFLTRSNAFTILRNGSTGINTAYPKAGLHVADSDVLFSRPGFQQSIAGTAPEHGSGTRMLWFSPKGAFRAGFMLGNFWDTDSIGLNSFATGSTTMAKGHYSFAAGLYSKAYSVLSIAMGQSSIAKGDYSAAIGNYCEANGLESIAIGPGNKANGRGSRGLGYGSTATGDFSVTLGDGSFAEGMSAVSTGIAAHASGQNSFAAGSYSTASGSNSFTSGSYTTASGNSSFAGGANSVASGITSFAMGNFAYGIGDGSAALGFSVFARAKGSATVGQYNDNTDNPSSSTDAAGDRIFQVGNGATNLTRSNAMTILRNGYTGIGTTTPANRLDIAGLNNWDLSNTEGDMRIGNSTYRIKMGVALGGGGAGAGIIRAMGGVNVLVLGAGNQNILNLYGATGNVGIGIENPTQKLHVAGNILATGTITPSDMRYKKDIQPIRDPLQKVQQINGVTYQYKAAEFPANGFDTTTQVGLIAQDVEKVFPQLVFTDDKGYKAVDYTKLIPLLVEGMKAQQKQIELLKEEVNKLKTSK